MRTAHSRLPVWEPGTYRLSASMPPARPDAPGWVLASAVIGGRETLDSPVELRQGVSDVVVTFIDRPTELSGTLRSPSGRPAPEYYIVLFAADRAYWTPQSRRIRAMRPSAEGAYTFRNLPPGEYLIAAVSDIEDGEWLDPAVLQQLGTAAMPITLADGEARKQDIQIGK